MARQSQGTARQGSAGEWFSDRALDPLREINGQCIDFLCAMADRGERGLVLLQELAPLWRRLGPDARRRLAECPCLLVDAGFGDELRWRQLVEHRVGEQPREWRNACLGGERGQSFARRVVTYGWHLARAHGSIARVALGMTPGSIERIASLGLRDLESAADLYPGWVRPRWESQVPVWRQLLTAAANADEAALQQAGLRGIQLLGAGSLAQVARSRPVD
ncbi:MAG: hypothetical protein RLZZ393_1588 [Pseudomonadota bacterium]|jgi:hypothetical protein